MLEITDLSERFLEETAKLDAAVFPESPWGKDAFSENIRNAYDHPVIALEDGEPVGYGILRQIDDGEILLIGVSAEKRGKGIGKEILSALLKRADREKGIFLEVREGNTAARRLYGNAGFTEIARRRNYYKDPQEDAVIMKL